MSMFSFFQKNNDEASDKQRGFTLLEMIVAVALFAVVMLVSVGALLSLVAASRKAQSLHLVVNNLNIALDAMVRSVRMGSSYHCGSGTITDPRDCSNGDALLAFKPFCNENCDPLRRWVYRYDASSGRIFRSVDGGANEIPVTADTVKIEEMTFYVVGTDPDDNIQPRVVIVVKGKAGTDDNRTVTEFNVQSTAVQRVLDL